jgi:hypothetical protein
VKKIHHFAYLRGSFADNPRLHELRDGEAFAEIQGALQKLGYTYGGLHLNFKIDAKADLIPTYDPSDVIVLTTRPPLDDAFRWDRLRIDRSYTKLENEILRHIRPFFALCRRTVIQLAPPVALELGTFADRAFIRFRVYGRPKKRSEQQASGKPKERDDEESNVAIYKEKRDPYVQRNRSAPETKPRTAAFLVVRRLEPKGPNMIVAFGMDGITTLVWCYLLRTRFPHLLRTPRFVMAEIWPREIPKNAQSLAFADDWRVDLLLNLSAKRFEALRLASDARTF